MYGTQQLKQKAIVGALIDSQEKLINIRQAYSAPDRSTVSLAPASSGLPVDALVLPVQPQGIHHQKYEFSLSAQFLETEERKISQFLSHSGLRLNYVILPPPNGSAYGSFASSAYSLTSIPFIPEETKTKILLGAGLKQLITPNIAAKHRSLIQYQIQDLASGERNLWLAAGIDQYTIEYQNRQNPWYIDAQSLQHVHIKYQSDDLCLGQHEKAIDGQVILQGGASNQFTITGPNGIWFQLILAEKSIQKKELGLRYNLPGWMGTKEARTLIEIERSIDRKLLDGLSEADKKLLVGSQQKNLIALSALARHILALYEQNPQPEIDVRYARVDDVYAGWGYTVPAWYDLKKKKWIAFFGDCHKAGIMSASQWRCNALHSDEVYLIGETSQGRRYYRTTLMMTPYAQLTRALLLSHIPDHAVRHLDLQGGSLFSAQLKGDRLEAIVQMPNKRLPRHSWTATLGGYTNKRIHLSFFDESN